MPCAMIPARGHGRMQRGVLNGSFNGVSSFYGHTNLHAFSATRHVISRRGQLGRTIGRLQWLREGAHYGDGASEPHWRSRTQIAASDPWVRQAVTVGRPSARAPPAPSGRGRSPLATSGRPPSALGSGSNGHIKVSSGGPGAAGDTGRQSQGSPGPVSGGGKPADRAPGGDAGSSAAIASAAVAASVAAAAVAGAVASAAPPPTPRTTTMGLLRRVVSLLRSNFLVVLMLYAIKDGAAFLLHRVTQRLTNHAAELLLGIPSSSTGNPWWLYLDPAFIRAHPGYELLIGLFFLACLPFTIAINSAAFTLAALICAPEHARRKAGAAEVDSEDEHPLPSVVAAGAAAAARPGARQTAINGVGGALHLPPDDPAAAALADLGIHALPTAPPPSPPPSRLAGGASSDSAVPPPSAALRPAFAPPSDEPPATASTIAAATSLAAAPPLPSGVPAANEGSTETTPTATIDEPSGGPLEALRAALASVGAVLPAAGRALRRVWWVDLQFNARALPLQGLCLLVAPALWALPRLMRIQLALPAAVLEGRAAKDALNRSSSLMGLSLSAYGVPFAGLLAAGRFLEYIQGVALVLIPPRWWREVVEVPLLIAGAFLLVKAAVHRLQDLLPLAAYLELSEQEAEGAKRQQHEVMGLPPPHPTDSQLGQQPRPPPHLGNGTGKPGLGAAAAGAAA